MKRKAVLAAAIIALAAPLAANASEQDFNLADQNRDGSVSEQEFYDTQDFERRMFFFRADRDNDRRLNAKEFKSVDWFIEMRRNASGE